MKEIIQHGKRNINIKYTNTCPMRRRVHNHSGEDIFTEYACIPMVSCPECGSNNITAFFPQTQYTYANMEVDQEGNIWNRSIK